MSQEPFTDPYRAPVATGEEAYPAGDITVDYTTGSSGTSDGDSTTDVAKDQAAQVGQGAADAGKHVAGVAKDQAGNVAGEAKAQARNLAEQARTEVQGQAHTQKQRATEGLRSIGHELGSMADTSEQPGTATDLARRASQAAHAAADWLEQRDPGDLVEEIRSFRRRPPGAFLGIAAAAGVLARRLPRGMTSTGATGSPAAHSTAGQADSGGVGYASPAYGTTATGAVYSTGTEPYTEYPATYPESDVQTPSYSSQDFPVDGDAIGGETR